MGYLGDQLQAALERKQNDVTQFVWKFPKDRNNNNEQKEIKLVNCTEDQLREFYIHCVTMLHNDDPKSPGRHNVMKLINDQSDRIGAELMLREWEETNPAFSRFALCDSINKFIHNQNSVAPGTVDPNHATVGMIFSDVSDKYSNLSLNTIINACTDQLGVFVNSHITKSFLLRRGVCPNREDNKKLEAFAERVGVDTKEVNKLDLIKKYLRLKEQPLKLNPKGLTVEDMRLMLTLKPKRIKFILTRTLQVLRYRILLDLQRIVLEHISRWETLKGQIEKVAEYKGYRL